MSRRPTTAASPAPAGSPVHRELAARIALYEADALLDAHVPGWRFQVQGREAVAQQLCALPRPGRFATFDREGTEHGLLVRP